MTSANERSQQRYNLKYEEYKLFQFTGVHYGSGYSQSP